MRKRMLLNVTVFAMIGVLVFGGTAMAGKPGTGTVRVAQLTGAQPEDGTGEFRSTLYPNKNKICYTIKAENIA